MQRRKKIILYILGIFIGAPLILALASYFIFTRNLPHIEDLDEYRPNLITKVYSRDGSVIGEFYIERRMVVPLRKVPDHLLKAFLAAEDAKFFKHKGIDYLSIVRAFYKNMSAGKIVQGGSTITQQVAKSFFLSPERRVARKVKEAILAYRIEKRLSKEDILYLYLNQIYFGNGAYGIQAAAVTYYGKNVEELDIAESALLAGLPKAPSKYSPYQNPKLARKRQRFVIQRMIEEGYITRSQADDALNRNLILKPKRNKNLWVGPYFTEHVRRYVEKKYGKDLLYKGGLHIFTTLDINMQIAANEAVDYGLRGYERRRGYRGPIFTLTEEKDIEIFSKEMDRKLLKNPLKLNGVYRGVVTSVDPRRKVIHVNVGSRKGKIKYRNFAWSKLYNPNPKLDPDGGKIIDPLTIFNPGDVIDVKVRYIPEPPEPVEHRIATIQGDGNDSEEGTGEDQKPKEIPIKDLPPIYLRLVQEPLAEAALVAMDPSTGYVKALVGGSSFKKTQFNRVVQAKRQPGSAFKPVTYLTALDGKYTPATIVVDSPIVFEEVVQKKEVKPELDENGVEIVDPNATKLLAEEEEPETWDWTPRNFEKKFHGPTTIRQALAKSRNVVTIKVLRDVGVKKAIETARKLGIESPLASDLSLALGSSAVTLMEMTRAFSTIANLGVRTEPIYITKVLDRYGNVLEENTPVSVEAISPQTAYLMSNLLQGVVENGTGWRARALKRPAAGKTGTTNNLNDAWFMGYVPNLVAGVWFGHDNEKPLGKNETGSKAAAPIWVKFMKKALEDVPPENFPIPDGVEFVRIDKETGLLANSSTKEAVFEVFKVGTTPTKVSPRIDAPGGDDFFMIDAGESPQEAPSKFYEDDLEDTSADEEAPPLQLPSVKTPAETAPLPQGTL
ncbi:Multimodular transpeptidase-transglycosylase [hydrothermal vent metagenome]|uniref:Penicillin-binding protein 1A n=1 Tax=hydrothermal vent metagenome TaxID=652676 RepID=A0A3B0QWR0_9ZZZZ